MGASFFSSCKRSDAKLVVEKGSSDVEYTFHLFVRPKDVKAEQWDGARSGVQAAQDVFNADEAQSIDALPSIPALFAPRVSPDGE